MRPPNTLLAATINRPLIAHFLMSSYCQQVGLKNKLTLLVHLDRFSAVASMSEDLPRIPIPGPEAETTEKMVFLQEQIVNFLRQYSMPLLEVSFGNMDKPLFVVVLMEFWSILKPCEASAL